MTRLLDKQSDVVEFKNPQHFIKSGVLISGRFPYTRKDDSAVKSFSTPYGDLSVGMWLGGEEKHEQQDAVFSGIDIYENLWMVVVDGLGGHPGGAQASKICCDVLAEEIDKVGFIVDDDLRDKIRSRMGRDTTIMSSPRKIGGACIALVSINGHTHKLHSYSMGDVEVGVLRRGAGLVLANQHDTSEGTNQVSKSLSPARRFHFTESKMTLKPGDKILVASDGLQNNAFRAFAMERISNHQQVQVAIEISKKLRNPKSDNLSIMCLESFRPVSNSPGFSTVQLERG